MTSALNQCPDFIIKEGGPEGGSFTAVWDNITYTFTINDRVGLVGFLTKETPNTRQRLAEAASLRQAKLIARNDVLAEFLIRQALNSVNS